MVVTGNFLLGTATVVMTVEDLVRGEARSVGEAVRTLMISAVCGAIGGVLPGGTLLANGMAGAIEGTVERTLNGEETTWAQLEFDFALSALTGGVLDGVGRAFSKKVAAKAAKKAAKELAEKVAKEAAEKVTKEAAEKSAKEAAEKVVKKIDDSVGISAAFKQTEFASSYKQRIDRTPSSKNKNVEFSGNRGETICKLKPPPDPDVQKILDDANIEGIQYKNGVPDFSPTSIAELEIAHMYGGVGDVFGNQARKANFAQADEKLANMINKSNEIAKKFNMISGQITAKDIRKYRKINKVTWHELNDVKTIQLVPTKVNGTFGHLGGVGEINSGAYSTGGFAN